MDTEIVVGILGLVGTIGGSLITYAGTSRKYKAEIERLQVERQDERERQFEKAQIGYRKLYEKFMKHLDEIQQSGDGVNALHDDYLEIQSVGFKPVCAALDAFWPEQQRVARELPRADMLGPLVEAMQLHGSMRLSELDEMRRRGEA